MITDDPDEEDGELLEDDIETIQIVTDKQEIARLGYAGFDIASKST